MGKEGIGRVARERGGGAWKEKRGGLEKGYSHPAENGEFCGPNMKSLKGEVGNPKKGLMAWIWWG